MIGVQVVLVTLAIAVVGPLTSTTDRQVWRLLTGVALMFVAQAQNLLASRLRRN
jgi:hypothetical protein